MERCWGKPPRLLPMLGGDTLCIARSLGAAGGKDQGGCLPTPVGKACGDPRVPQPPRPWNDSTASAGTRLGRVGALGWEGVN